MDRRRRRPWQRLAAEPFDAVLLDYKMPGLNGLETLVEIKQAHIKTPVIIMTAHGTTETAIEAMKLGAYDYLLKPFDTEELKRIVADAMEVIRLMKEVVSLPDGADARRAAERPGTQIVGTHRKMQAVFKLIGQVAEKDVTVLITGESGTGKELVARAIYHHSHRKDSPFMAVNCASIPDTLFESELFGYEQGAFTGADRTYLGKFERCHDGTLFFDEIGDMSLTHAGQGAARAAGGRVRAARQHADHQGQRAHAGRHQQEPGKGGGGGPLPRGPLLPAEDHLHPPAAAARAARRRAGPGRLLRRPLRRTSIASRSATSPSRRSRKLRSLRLAGQRPRVGKLPAAGGADVQGRRAAARTRPLRGRAGRRRAAAPPERPVAATPEAADRRHWCPRSCAWPDRSAHANVIDLVEEALIAQALEECRYNQVHTARMLGISRNTLRHRIKKYHLEPQDT